jgi:hypothetical protein
MKIHTSQQQCSGQTLHSKNFLLMTGIINTVHNVNFFLEAAIKQ